MFKSFLSAFRNTPEGIMTNIRTAYGIGYKLQKRNGGSEKTCHEYAVFHVFRMTYKCTPRQLLERCETRITPKLKIPDIENPQSYFHELAPFMLMPPEQAKQALAHYWAWLIYGNQPPVDCNFLTEAISAALIENEEEFDDEMLEVVINWMPAWLPFALHALQVRSKSAPEEEST